MSIKRITLTLLAAWLILTGLLPLLNVSFSGLGLIMNLLALTVGILLLWKPGALTKGRNLGLLLLGVWLLLMGLMSLLSLTFRFSDLVLNLLAIAAGVVLLLEQRG